MTLATTGFGTCPECGALLTAEPWAPGLCLSCLLELGLPAEDPAAAVEGEADVLTVSHIPGLLTAGQILGNRYRIRTLLGSGGMGEVFRAFDLKLRVDVALKAVRPGLLADDRVLGALRQEVRAAREVVSPNVCRVFDLVEFDGRELVSMEYVDGITLAGVLGARSPLKLQEAREIASQFLAGLEAIHAAGLVHRDLKPENLMLTRSGRVVVMDFGIARAMTPVAGGTIAGTPAYMAAEQARGEAIDARADVFSAGVVLAEIVAPAGVRTHQAREAVWRGVHGDPPEVGDTPWTAVLRRAVARIREARYPTAAAFARALEEVTLRTAADEVRRPYPGLASFAEADAEYFVGRELEVEELWKKLRRPQLLALIGPSGAGKSSFLRAGLRPTAPPGWRIIFATPGDRPFAALAHALAPELSGDVEAVARLIDFEDIDVAIDIVARWRRRHEQALLIFDQFEELFTQSPSDVQERFAQLLARLALEADVHVLLSMRDDFLFHCHTLESLAPVFSELTAIGPPTGAALRRALVQPALKCGYRFEDETVVEEMLAQVAGERGALPLVAFAMARLWDRRDRERGLLTRAAYDEIGGVGGALAQHAEATLERVGQERLPIVRELFRNLITAQGTRATLERDELLSVFAERARDGASGPASRRQDATEVLDALIDARLLTSYELPSGEGDTGDHRIEVVHESLLTAWPRLVRWQTQDQDGAQLRDQLRQAARLWEQRGRPEDLLWTGTSYREYELWRERYAGTLSASEDTFTRAMTARALRRRRQRRLGVSALVAAALTVAIAMSVLWRQSETARRHADAQQLFALGQLELTHDPSAALAYALASLERDDTSHARRFALRARSEGPTAFVMARANQVAGARALEFSRDGRWLVALDPTNGSVSVWKNDGTIAREIPGSGGPGNFASMGISGDSRSVVVTQSDSVRIHSLAAAGEDRRIAGSFRWGKVRGQSVVTGSSVDATPDGQPRRLIRMLPLPTGAPESSLGVLTMLPASGAYDIDPAAEWMFSVYGGDLYEILLRQLGAAPRLVVHGDEPIGEFVVSPDGTTVYTWSNSGKGRIWSRATGAPLMGPHLIKSAQSRLGSQAISPDGRWLATANSNDETVHLWDVSGPVDVEPLLVRTGARPVAVAFDPSETWMAVQDHEFLALRPLPRHYPHVLRGPGASLRDVAIDPRGRWVAAGAAQTNGSVQVWPLRAGAGAPRATFDLGGRPITLEASPRGDLCVSGTDAGVWLIPLDGRPPERFPGFARVTTAVAFDQEGRRVAAGGGSEGELTAPGEAVIRILNLDTRQVQILEPRDGKAISRLAFMADGRLLSAGDGGVRLWDLSTAASTPVIEGVGFAVPSPDGRYLLGIRSPIRGGGPVGPALVYDLLKRTSWPLPTHGDEVSAIAWAGTRVVTGSRDYIVRVGAMTGEEPHLLIGHDARIWNLRVDPSGRWIASVSDDGTLRLWPIPEGRPFHTLPRNELVERLRSLTNYRIVQDAAASSGYRLGFEPFVGWNRKPPDW